MNPKLFYEPFFKFTAVVVGMNLLKRFIRYFAVFLNPARNRNADLEYFYAQNSDFFYLTGFREPNSILVLIPKGTAVRNPSDSTKMITVHEMLFVQERDPISEKWNGRRYGPEGAMKLRGLEHAATNDKFKTMLPLT